MRRWRRGKLTVLLILFQVIFIVLFSLFAEYDKSADPRFRSFGGDAETVERYYGMFQNLQVMLLIGFGLFLTFMKKYGYSSSGYNLLLAAFAIQWSIIIRGFFKNNGAGFSIGIKDLLAADFAAIAVLISYGAVLGKTSPHQLLIMAVIELPLAQVNEFIGYHIFKVTDLGRSMFIHVFGAYFGLGVARTLASSDLISRQTKQDGSVYHSDLFSMIGTLFLWIYWPSFNAGESVGDDRHRAVINTYFSLTASVLTAFALSTAFDEEGKLNMFHIQSATLAGGIGMGTCANLVLEPWGALVIGCCAGFLSVIGCKYLTPFLSSKAQIQDTCGVHDLFGLPGVLGAVAGAVVAAFSSEEQYGNSLYAIFPARLPSDTSSSLFISIAQNVSGIEAGLDRTARNQGGYQMAALGVTMAIAIVGGLLTGLILRAPIWDNPSGYEMFADVEFWDVPSEDKNDMFFNNTVSMEKEREKEITTKM